ncbi:MAG: lysophospholipid acyltransferase family protein [Geobacteraceae bacterium]|nr:lysophospholipid acyltransferase family protein [Geobacteraceae bacterium]
MDSHKEHKQQKKQIISALEALPFLALARIARILPRMTALRLGAILGRGSRFMQPERRKIAYTNLKHAYPEKSEEWIDTQIKRVFEHLGVSGIEMLRLDKFNSRADLERYFTFDGLEHLEQIRAEGTGAFILSAHIGFWEVGTFFMPMLGYDVDFVAKRIRNKYVHDFFERQREAAGGRCIESKRGARRIMRSLMQKRMVCLLLDQHPSKKHALLADFFGRPAYTTPVIAQMALKAKVPVVPVFVFRKPDYTYHVEIGTPLRRSGEASPENVAAFTREMTHITEEAIRKKPDQWFWVHRRWRSVTAEDIAAEGQSHGSR